MWKCSLDTSVRLSHFWWLLNSETSWLKSQPRVMRQAIAYAEGQFGIYESETECDLDESGITISLHIEFEEITEIFYWYHTNMMMFFHISNLNRSTRAHTSHAKSSHSTVVHRLISNSFFNLPHTSLLL